MLRDTMMRTIPVAMTAIEVLWTERFQRFRAVRKSPPERMWKAIQIARRARIMPNSRVSISVDVTAPRHDRACAGGAIADAGPSSGVGVSTVLIDPPAMLSGAPARGVSDGGTCVHCQVGSRAV